MSHISSGLASISQASGGGVTQLAGTNAVMQATTGVAGQFFFNSTYNTSFYWDNTRWWPTGGVDPKYGTWFFDDFISSSTVGSNGWGGNGNASITGSTAATGIFRARQATTGSVSYVNSELDAWWLNSSDIYYEASVAIPTQSTGTDDFAVAVGFNNSNSFATLSSCTNGVYFSQSRIKNGQTWIANVFGGAVGSSVFATGLAPTAGVYQRLGIFISGATAIFSIGGTNVATIGTNVPGNTSTGLIFRLDKTAGSSNSDLLIDYVNIYQFFTPARVT